MLRTTEIKTAAATRISPRRLLVALLALLVALAPASAMAGVGPITSSGNCTATVRTANNTSEVARISVDCRSGTITNVNLRTNGRNEVRARRRQRHHMRPRWGQPRVQLPAG